MALGSLLGGFAGGAIGTAVVQLVLDGRQYQGELAKAEALGKSTTTGMTKSFSAFKAAAGLAFVAAGAAAIRFAADAVQAASAQEEALNKTRVVFEQSAKSVEAFADSSASAFGISKTAALEAAGGFGQMLLTSGLAEDAAASMSVELVALAADLASFNNIAIEGADGALAKLQSGLAGEAEPLRRLGILLSETRVKTEAYESGIAAVGAELTDAQKVQARYNLILADTAKAQGDFGRTSGSLANQQRILAAEFENTKAELGASLLPLFKDLVTIVRDGVPIIKALGAATVEALAPIADLVTLVADAIHQWEAALEGAEEEVDQFGPKVRGSFEDAYGGIEEAIARGDISLQEGAEQLVALQREFERFGVLVYGTATNVEFLRETAFFAGDTFEDVGRKAHGMARGVKDAKDETGSFLGLARAELKGFRDSMEETFQVGSTTFEELADKARVSANQILASLRRQVKAQENYQENLEELKDRNIPDALLEQLTALGLDGAAIIEALANANKQRFREIVSEWKTSETNARSIANAIAGIGNAVTNLPTNKTVNIHFNVTSTVSAALNAVVAQVDDAIRNALARTGGA
jgi:predicted DNA-binding protein YlxM (UPF0122 family)